MLYCTLKTTKESLKGGISDSYITICEEYFKNVTVSRVKDLNNSN